MKRYETTVAALDVPSTCLMVILVPVKLWELEKHLLSCNSTTSVRKFQSTNVILAYNQVTTLLSVMASILVRRRSLLCLFRAVRIMPHHNLMSDIASGMGWNIWGQSCPCWCRFLGWIRSSTPSWRLWRNLISLWYWSIFHLNTRGRRWSHPLEAS